MFAFEKCVSDAVNDRYRFVCTIWEFKERYGVPTHRQAVALGKWIVLCKDGFIRPR